MWKFGPCYTRYLTFQGLTWAPPDGALTLDRQVERTVTAGPWDRLPAEAILTWTLIPRAPVAMERGQRFAIREGGRTIGAGRVTEIIP